MELYEKPHSAEYFGEQRDYWWNRDYLELLAKRGRFSQIHSVLDVGCGVGHWGQLLLTQLPKDATLVGVDREPIWVSKAAERAERQGIHDRCRYLQGEAQSLPVPDAKFDLVTCQTVLIHVASPKEVIREMRRALKPEGLLLVAEPNNWAAEAVWSSLSKTYPTEALIEVARFHLMCERGKEALGLGFNSIGDLVPGYFAEEGLEDIAVHLSDKASPLFPPYSSPEQRALLKQSLDWLHRDFWIWDRPETMRYFFAGGGTPEGFESLWARVMKMGAELEAAVEAGTYHSGGGALTYIVSGRKPASGTN